MPNVANIDYLMVHYWKEIMLIFATVMIFIYLFFLSRALWPLKSRSPTCRTRPNGS